MTRVLAAGEAPDDGGWLISDLPRAVRAVVSVLLEHRVADGHVCEWPDGIQPPMWMRVGNCNCGAYIDAAQQIVALISTHTSRKD